MTERIALDAIEKLGEYVSDCRWSAGIGAEVIIRGLDGAEYPEIADAVRPADAEWIAFFDPPTVYALAAELRAARKARDQLSRFYDRLDFVGDAEALSAILLTWDAAP